MIEAVISEDSWDIEVFSTDNGFEVTVPIAEDCARCMDVTVRSFLSSPSFDEESWEFSFEIYVDYWDGSDEPFATQERNMATAYIPSDIRSYVIHIAIESCIAMVEFACYPPLYRVTKGRHLPEKALRKHYMLTSALQDVGYRVIEDGVDGTGRVYWVLAL